MKAVVVNKEGTGVEVVEKEYKRTKSWRSIS